MVNKYKPYVAPTHKPKKSASTSLTELLDVPSTPLVFVTQEVSSKIKYLVNNASEEIAWWGVCSRDTTDETLFYIHDIACPNKQEVTATACEWTNEEYGKSYDKLTQSESNPYDLDNECPDKGMRGDWYMGHSHVNMGTSPSETDMEQMLEAFEIHNMPFAIQTIHNKRGEMFICIYDFENKIVYEDVKWYVDGLSAEVTAVLDEAINSTTTPAYTPLYNPSSHVPYTSLTPVSSNSLDIPNVPAASGYDRNYLEELADLYGVSYSEDDTNTELDDKLLEIEARWDT